MLMLLKTFIFILMMYSCNRIDTFRKLFRENDISNINDLFGKNFLEFRDNQPDITMSNFCKNNSVFILSDEDIMAIKKTKSLTSIIMDEKYAIFLRVCLNDFDSTLNDLYKKLYLKRLNKEEFTPTILDVNKKNDTFIYEWNLYGVEYIVKYIDELNKDSKDYRFYEKLSILAENSYFFQIVKDSLPQISLFPDIADGRLLMIKSSGYNFGDYLMEVQEGTKQKKQIKDRIVDYISFGNRLLDFNTAMITFCNFKPSNILYNPKDPNLSSLVNYEHAMFNFKNCNNSTYFFSEPEFVNERYAIILKERLFSNLKVANNDTTDPKYNKGNIVRVFYHQMDLNVVKIREIVDNVENQTLTTLNNEFNNLITKFRDDNTHSTSISPNDTQVNELAQKLASIISLFDSSENFDVYSLVMTIIYSELIIHSNEMNSINYKSLANGQNLNTVAYLAELKQLYAVDKQVNEYYSNGKETNYPYISTLYFINELHRIITPLASIDEKSYSMLEFLIDAFISQPKELRMNLKQMIRFLEMFENSLN